MKMQQAVSVREHIGQRRLSRRSAVQIGFCGALGLSLGDLLRGEARAAADGQAKEGTAKSIIHLHLPGGMAQQESWDPKPEAPVEYRGAFQIAKTATGEVFSENFARTAKVADKLTIVRSVVGKIPDHGQATYHLFTGYTPSTVIDYPQMGAVVSQHFGPRRGLPPYVAIPNMNGFSGGTGFLSSKYGAFQLGADPGERSEFKVQDFSLPSNVSTEQFDRRRSARSTIEGHLRRLHADVDQLNTMDDFYQRAYSLLTSTEAQQAFSLAGEPAAMQELYGTDYILKARREPAGVGKRLMLARRLVEAGVRFVTVTYGAWDSHTSIKDDCLDKMPALDHAIAGLLTDLDQRGLLDSTLVMVTTEFGRTPKINSSNGRDHWARVYSMLLAGGGITRGQIYGASDATAAEPARDAVPLEDFLFTVYHQLGIRADEELMAFGTRPIEIVRDGKLVNGIIAQVMRRIALLVIAQLLFVPALARAMVHHLESTTPRCGQRGSTVEVTFHGVSLHDPREVIFYKPGIRASDVEPLPPLERRTSLAHGGYVEERARCKFVIAPDCPLGEHPFRLRTATELTGLSTFHVTRFAVVDETETKRGQNDSLADAQSVPMNVTVRGRMDTNREPDIDVYRVTGKAGEHLSVEIDSVWLTDKHYAELEFDLMVRLVDARGRELARNDDSALHIQDPIVSTLLPSDGDYFVEVRQRIDRSGPFVYYAAHIGNNRRPLAVYPAGGQAGQKLSATLLGDPAGNEGTQIALPSTTGDFEFSEGLPSPLPMRVSEYPNLLETTGNAETPVSQLPAALNGIIETPGETDVFQLSVKKGDRYRVRVYARSLGTPLDPRIWIQHIDADAPEVEADDATYQERGLYAVANQVQRKERLDPSVVWEPRQDGEYRLGISDMRSLGGPTSVYRVEIEPLRDSIYTYPYSRVIDSVECLRLTGFVVPQGDRWTVNIGLAEGQGNRYRGELEVEARGLPPGVRMIAPRVSQGESVVPVQLVAEANTPPQVALFELYVKPVDAKHELVSGSQQAFPFLGHSGGAAWRSVVVNRYVLAVTERAPFSVELVPPQIPLSINGELALAVHVARRQGFDEPIEFQADWTPPGVSAQPTVTVPAGESSAVYRIFATTQARPLVRSLAVNATTTGGFYYLGAGRIRASSAFVDLTIADAYVALKNQAASIRRGERGQIVWDVTHKQPFAGEAEAVLLGLPKGVSVVEPGPRLKAGDKQLVFEIVAGDEVLLGQYKDLSCEIVVRQGGQEIRQRTGTGILRVDPPLKPAAGKTVP